MEAADLSMTLSIIVFIVTMGNAVLTTGLVLALRRAQKNTADAIETARIWKKIAEDSRALVARLQGTAP